MKAWFQKQVLAWYKIHGRQHLPWKKALSPYRVWVSEIMLQQTQVATVIPYFEKFMQSFTNIEALANANIDSVLHHWAGLGYYARGRNLHKAAKMIVEDHAGQFPNTVEELITLPGIGLSTAGAIVAQAFNKKATICDGNVKRVLSRFHCVKGALGQKDVENTLWDLAVKYTPNEFVADYTQAMMDIGATLCTRTRPDCERCPLKTRCQAYKNNLQTAFPERAKAKRLPLRQAHFLCAINSQQEILLTARPDKGIWGGLWCLPEFDSQAALESFVKGKLKSGKTLAKLPPLKHTFTHFHLTLKPLLLMHAKKLKTDTPEYKWVDTKMLKKLGVPAPIKKILHYDIIEEKMRDL
ncbi:MAG: A/G-specific adenine glycosylase [Proteobacteria bacterium]|nr:A/G-specific adenine glycosylase [Pseudomonadota bacterium]